MDTSHIAELLQPFVDAQGPESSHPERSEGDAVPLTGTQLGQISTYIDLLLRWNARVNLTAVRDHESIVTRHFGEALFAAIHVVADAPVRPAERSSAVSTNDQQPRTKHLVD